MLQAIFGGHFVHSRDRHATLVPPQTNGPFKWPPILGGLPTPRKFNPEAYLFFLLRHPTMSQFQCRGTTQKGLRCKKTVPLVGGYCHYHQPTRAEPTLTQKPPPRLLSPHAPGDKPGFIYVYTLTSLINDTALWLKVRNLPNAPKRHRDKWVGFDAAKQPYTLIKVGMTTQTVQRRLNQWQAQCHHDLTCLYPRPSKPPSSSAITSLVSRLKKMSISSAAKKNTRTSSFSSLRTQDQGFYVAHHVAEAEAQIHAVLRKKYGSGDVLCSSCKKNSKVVEEVESQSKLLSMFKKTSGQFSKGTYNVHVEWFLIPKDDLNHVFTVIDTVCTKSNGQS